MLTIFLWLALTAQKFTFIDGGYSNNGSPDQNESLKCHRLPYRYKVEQYDDTGRKCSGDITVMACWGRCDSKEISDWRFPFKKSNHPVCVHYGRIRVVTELNKCDEGVKEGTQWYEYLEAEDCKCQLCSSSDTSCEGLRFRQSSKSMGFRMNDDRDRY